MDDYYVYVYIDPRNFEEFYYGKGKGSRKDAHLKGASSSEKSKLISEIRAEGLEPIVRVIAGGLSEHDAFLVETTLIWKLGKHLKNNIAGQYSDKFRPHDTFHKQLPGFDFQNFLYYYNVGEGSKRNWEDYIKFGFISGGYGPVWKKAMQGFRVGDLVAAYISGRGYVGIGKLTQEARPINNVFINNKPFLQMDLVSKNIGELADDPDYCEYIALVDWLAIKDRTDAAWVRNDGLFTSRSLRASLADQPRTVKFLEERFSINLSEYLL